MYQGYKLKPKKIPKQKRSKATFDALIEACELILPQRGYNGITTNHIADAAGVGIGSLYEYFPGKDAVIMQAAERVANRLIANTLKKLPPLANVPKNEFMEALVTLIVEALKEEQELARVFMYEVPYTNQISKDIGLVETLVDLSEKLAKHVDQYFKYKPDRASFHLLVNLITTSIFQITLNPAKGISREQMIKTLAERINIWVGISENK